MNEQTDKKLKNPMAVAIAAICTIFFITLITVLADLVPPLKDWLKAVFTHHWIGKGVLSIGLFVFLYLLLKKTLPQPSESRLASMIRLLSWFAVLGTLVLFGFFLYETFGNNNII
ncbi:MAG: hypothetical protein U1C57_00375 [Candidatus Doudnabacteria bacterium]|nr:hypothetical protein [Candidatus Doudnabacteria bacterium]